LRGVEVLFGTAVDARTGAIEGLGTEFPAGTSQLCVRVRYWGQPSGSSLRYEWISNGYEVDLAGLNGSIDLAQPSGFEFQCVFTPAGPYEVRAYVGADAEPAGWGRALVFGGP
jgi:hypothetical protein